MKDFATLDIRSWGEFIEAVASLPGEWVYRGQSRDWPLSTSLERTLSNWDVILSGAPVIEQQIIRDFRRQYRGSDQIRVNSDTLYCLALMQHHGAPTRLLDWTYSPFVAAKFALDLGGKDGVVWCLNLTWSYKEAVKIAGSDRVYPRSRDSARDDSSFLPLYMPEGEKQAFVFPETPLQLNERLIIQQGTFMCQGDVGTTFIDNLMVMNDWTSASNIFKMRLLMDRSELTRFALILRRMNVDSAVLFPGLDGFARSLHERLPLYAEFAGRHVGTEPPK